MQPTARVKRGAPRLMRTRYTDGASSFLLLAWSMVLRTAVSTARHELTRRRVEALRR
jgi:hypothetical protein